MSNAARTFIPLDRWLLRRIIPPEQKLAILRVLQRRCVNCGDAATGTLCTPCARELQHDQQVEEEMRHDERDEPR